MHNYILAITPRSGSTMLCDILSSTGLAGDPKEYLNMNRMKKILSEDEFKKYISVLQRRRVTSNGVFGIKMSYIQAEPYMTGNLLHNSISNPKYVCLFRKNIVKQAISSYIAAESRKFHVEVEKKVKIPDVPYNRGRILNRIKNIRQQERKWMRYFEDNSLSYIKLFYEDIVEDTHGCVKLILRYIGIDESEYCGKSYGGSRYKKISTPLNDEFYYKIKDDAELQDLMEKFSISPCRVG